MAVKRIAEAIWIESRGYWQVKVQRNGTRKTFYSPIKGKKGKHAAERKADAWLDRAAEDMRFDTAWAMFMDYQRENTGTSNCIKHDQHYKLYLSPNIGIRRLSTITPIQWQRCIDEAARKGLSRRSCINIRASIISFMRYALRCRMDVQRLEEGDLTIPQSAKEKNEKRVLQPTAIRMLFDDPCIERYGRKSLCAYSYAWQFLVVTGLRRGELCGLKTEDVSNDTITIRRSINAVLEETSGKNKNAQRTIHLTEIAKAVLHKQSEMLHQNGIRSCWLFPDKYGDRANPNNLYGQWRMWTKQHGIQLSIHELRHTFISVNKLTMPLELLKSVVGHSANMDTFGVYGHEIDGERERAANIVDTTFASILGQSGL